jgi:hypothetical protein
MKLVYINKIGNNWKGDFIYEFLFSDAIEDIDGEGWESFPSAGNPQPPSEDFVKKTGSLVTKINFDVIQESDSFCMWDAVDGLVAISWENLDGYDDYPETRIYFSFGEEMESVKDKLYERDLIINFDKELLNI